MEFEDEDGESEGEGGEGLTVPRTIHKTASMRSAILKEQQQVRNFYKQIA
jgi:hypothetical protein